MKKMMNKVNWLILLTLILFAQPMLAAEPVSPSVNAVNAEGTESTESEPVEQTAEPTDGGNAPAMAAEQESATTPVEAANSPVAVVPEVSASEVTMPEATMTQPMEGDSNPVDTTPAELPIAPTVVSKPVEVVPEKTRTLDARVQSLKKEVKALNRDLFILEEELLFPSSTQVAIFLSIDVGQFFRLDSVQVKIDDTVVANHLYTKRELGALERGGVQRLYIGNVKSGEHELIATFRGPGPNNREYRRGTTLKFTKSSAAKFMELKILDATRKLQPEFVVKEWE